MTGPRYDLPPGGSTRLPSSGMPGAAHRRGGTGPDGDGDGGGGGAVGTAMPGTTGPGIATDCGAAVGGPASVMTPTPILAAVSVPSGA
jgi:hypothetical protein